MLAEFASETNAGVIILTESHLSEEIKDGEIQIPGFEIYRTDRSGFKNGGVVAYLRTALNLGVKLLLSTSITKVETLVLKFERLDTILVGLYRPPDAACNEFRTVLQMINDVISANGGIESSIILTGDFNMPIINWNTREINGGTRNLQSQAEALLELSDQLYMNQYVREPTRGTNILDLFFVNDGDLVLKTEVQPPSILSDHQLIVVTTSYSTENDAPFSTEEVKGIRSLNFSDNRIDWLRLDEAINTIDWDILFLEKNPTEMFDLFENSISQICASYVPLKNARLKSSIPKDRKILMRKRCNLNKKITSADELQRCRIIEQIRLIEQKLMDSHTNEMLVNEAKAVSKIKGDPKYFYRYAKSKSVTRTPIGPFIANGNLIYDPVEKANVLLEQYSSVYSSTGYDGELLNEISVIPGPRCLDTVDISLDDINDAIDDLSAGSSPGPDGIPALLLKQCKNSLQTPIRMLWRNSMLSGVIPQKLKFGSVTPIYKGGDKCDPKNYRPITLTSHIIKICEKIIVKKLVEFMDDANLFNKHQHGFRRGRSCLSQLLEHYQLILKGMENGDAVAVIYLDFCKAFDKVDHRIVLEKLHALGVSGNILRWIGNFLIGTITLSFFTGWICEEWSPPRVCVGTITLSYSNIGH